MNVSARIPSLATAERGVLRFRRYTTQNSEEPVVRIANGTFYRHHPSSKHVANPTLFEKLNFELPSFTKKGEYWAVIGPSGAGKTTFLQILREKRVCVPPNARTYPWLHNRSHSTPRQVHSALRYVGFEGAEAGLGGLGTGPQAAYLSARYESRREATDFSVLDYLKGNMELNPLHGAETKAERHQELDRVIKDMRLEDLVHMPVSNLSNGQTRRARIAAELYRSPEVLLLDEPFMGLDPPTLLTLSPIFYELAKANAPRILMTLRPQDPIPDWITHLIYLSGPCKVGFQGVKEKVLEDVKKSPELVTETTVGEIGRSLTSSGIIEPAAPKVGTEQETARSRDGFHLVDRKPRKIGEALVEMEGARVTYGTKSVLGNWTQEVDGVSRDGLWWTIKRGERWGIFGPNGSGKTTILSLICSDHPQTYSLPIRLFGRSRLPEPGRPGISVFDIQARIGHSSPEIHNHIPKSLTLRQLLANAWSETFRGVPKLDDNANKRIDACLRWFEHDLRPGSPGAEAVKGASAISAVGWADDVFFGGLPFSAQRVALFLRAIIKQPDIVILDEAFSGMDDSVRDRCLLFLAHGESKQFSSSPNGKRKVVDSELARSDQVVVQGLNDKQALVCISHVREEIPGSVREWICLPEANTRQPARFGKLDGPIEGDYRRWNEIWGM